MRNLSSFFLKCAQAGASIRFEKSLKEVHFEDSRTQDADTLGHFLEEAARSERVEIDLGQGRTGSVTSALQGDFGLNLNMRVIKGDTILCPPNRDLPKLAQVLEQQIPQNRRAHVEALLRQYPITNVTTPSRASFSNQLAEATADNLQLAFSGNRYNTTIENTKDATIVTYEYWGTVRENLGNDQEHGKAYMKFSYEVREDTNGAYIKGPFVHEKIINWNNDPKPTPIPKIFTALEQDIVEEIPL